jgi:hypothetical protein
MTMAGKCYNAMLYLANFDDGRVKRALPVHHTYPLSSDIQLTIRF